MQPSIVQLQGKHSSSFDRQTQSLAQLNGTHSVDHLRHFFNEYMTELHNELSPKPRSHNLQWTVST
jgi:hypothetical protein